jgi:amino acid transporter
VKASSTFKRIMLGRPLATAEEMQERLSKKLALPVFSSDAISSTAYATEEILLALAAAGAAALTQSLYISLGVAFLLAIVALSYQQTVHAYPSGGGSYIVARENLGLASGLTAAASLMVDYVMTVAVSTASGVAAITSAFPGLFNYRVIICVAVIIVVALANLRGMRESGRLFALPTYLFILLCSGLVIVGLVRWMMGDLPAVVKTANVQATQGLTLFLILKAFSGGCSAMTGTEAISNAVPAFKPPESRNAGMTLGIMASVLGFLLVGVTALARIIHVAPYTDGSDTVLSQIARAVYGGGFFYFALQIATMAILFLGANTSYAGFPRLSSVLARDGLMPRQFMNRGDRLVFSNGIIGLTIASILVVIIFGGKTHSMIPLYAVGVFLSFTLSQGGMVVHWFKLRAKGWQRKAAMNGLGATLTGVVAVVITVTKFVHGAYIVVIAVVALIAAFYTVRRHYDRVAHFLQPQSQEQLERLGEMALSRQRTTVVLFVSQVNELTARSLALGRGLSPDDFHAATIASDPDHVLALQRTWTEMGINVPLLVVDSPYRELVRPALDYVRSLRPSPSHSVTVIIPEFIVEHRWENFLHNRNAHRLKAALLGAPWVVVISIPFHIAAAEADESNYRQKEARAPEEHAERASKGASIISRRRRKSDSRDGAGQDADKD